MEEPRQTTSSCSSSLTCSACLSIAPLCLKQRRLALHISRDSQADSGTTSVSWSSIEKPTQSFSQRQTSARWKSYRQTGRKLFNVRAIGIRRPYESRRDVDQGTRAQKALGHFGDWRRGDRSRSSGGCGHQRVRCPSAREGRLWKGYLQPRHKARSRWSSLLGARQRLASDGGP